MADLFVYHPPQSALRLSLFKRANIDRLPPFKQPTRRDLAIIEAVYAFRALTTPQIEALLFHGNPSQFQPTARQPQSGRTNRCRHRLKVLYHYGYLHREELPVPLSYGRKPLVYFLDKRGKETLCRWYGLDPQEIDWEPRLNTVGEPFIEHLLQTNDIRVAVTVAAQRHSFTLATWLDDRTLRKAQNRDYVLLHGPKGTRPRRVAVVPDGYFHLQNPEFHFVLETDRRTVVGQYSRWGGKDWSRKVRAYIAYFTPPAPGQPSIYEQRFGTSKLRVLTVTTGPTRLENLKHITEQAGGRDRFWFTTFDQLTPQTVLTEPIWQKAGAAGQFRLVV